MFSPKTKLEQAVAFCFCVGCVFILSPWGASSHAKENNNKNGQTEDVKLGAYDPYGSFSKDRRLSIEHVYMPWRDINLSSLDKADRYARVRGRELLITIEPWSWSKRRSNSARRLYRNIVRGKYNRRIRRTCLRINRLKSPVTIRWGHEMDIKNKRYLWSRWSPSRYKRAYRYFVDHCRSYARKAQYMWSPRGEKMLSAYYPGDKYVDRIGLTVLALQKFDIDKFGSNRKLREWLRPGYMRVIQYKKPIEIAEFGCVGDEEYRDECHQELGQLKSIFKRLRAVIYFNEKETYPWPRPYGYPDWRVPSKYINLKISSN